MSNMKEKFKNMDKIVLAIILIKRVWKYLKTQEHEQWLL